MGKQEQAINYVRNILAGYCNYPDEIKIECVSDERGIVVNIISAHPDDWGQIIGHKGIGGFALRKIMQRWSFKNGLRTFFIVRGVSYMANENTLQIVKIGRNFNENTY